MPIKAFLAGRVFEPDAIEKMSAVFRTVSEHLRLMDRNDQVNEVIAEKIISLVQHGAGLDATMLLSRTMTEFNIPETTQRRLTFSNLTDPDPEV
jgi:hypothetical protein